MQEKQQKIEQQGEANRELQEPNLKFDSLVTCN